MAESRSTMASYAELAKVISVLPLLLREARRARGLSQRAAAQQLGMSFATVSRMEAGNDCALSNAVAVLRWLDSGRPAEGFQLPITPAVPSFDRCKECGLKGWDAPDLVPGDYVCVCEDAPP